MVVIPFHDIIFIDQLNRELLLCLRNSLHSASISVCYQQCIVPVLYKNFELARLSCL